MWFRKVLSLKITQGSVRPGAEAISPSAPNQAGKRGIPMEAASFPGSSEMPGLVSGCPEHLDS